MTDHANIAAAIHAGAPHSFPDSVVTARDRSADCDRIVLVYHLRSELGVTTYAVFAIGATPCRATVKVKNGNPVCQSARCADAQSGCVHEKAVM